MRADLGTAWEYGIHLGLHCSRCCAGLMAILLAVGMTDLRAMAAVTAAITVERLDRSGERVVRAIGAVIVVTGVLMVIRAVAR